MITKLERIDIYPTELRFTEANLPRAFPPAPLKQRFADGQDDDDEQLGDDALAERWESMNPKERASALNDPASANDAALMARAYALRAAGRSPEGA